MIESVQLKGVEYPKFLSKELLESWAEGIPTYSENDPANPEWKATPWFELDLTSLGYGNIIVKNEADTLSNPTGTIKDRAFWEFVCVHRDSAKALLLKEKNGKLKKNLEEIAVPTLSGISSGNLLNSASYWTKKYNLPPINAVIGTDISKSQLTEIMKMNANIYQIDLTKQELSSEDIKKITKNNNSSEITSLMVIEPNSRFYDWHVPEVFNLGAENIFVPYGSGRIVENYLTWQQRTIHNFADGKIDPRLKVSPEKVINMSIFGAEPENRNSEADKLTKSFNPFVIFKDNDISTLKNFAWTGDATDVYKVKEEYISLAYTILSKHCKTSHSGAAGLALYLQKYDEGKINPIQKSVIVNSGRGI